MLYTSWLTDVADEGPDRRHGSPLSNVVVTSDALIYLANGFRALDHRPPPTTGESARGRHATEMYQARAWRALSR